MCIFLKKFLNRRLVYMYLWIIATGLKVMTTQKDKGSSMQSESELAKYKSQVRFRIQKWRQSIQTRTEQGNRDTEVPVVFGYWEKGPKTDIKSEACSVSAKKCYVFPTGGKLLLILDWESVVLSKIMGFGWPCSHWEGEPGGQSRSQWKSLV